MISKDIGIAALLFALAVAAQYSGLDLWLAGHFYDASAHQWPWRDTWLTSTVLHTGARKTIVLIAVLMLLAWVLTFIRPGLRAWRRPLGYLLVASLAGPVVVSVLKSMTHLYTPWVIREFGGNLPHLRLFDPVPAGLPVGHAFPAGHASAGYGFFSLYFLARYLRPAMTRAGLLVPVILGGTLGVDQQIRGAHFLSHDLTTAAICWLSAALLAWWFFRRHQVREETAPQPA